MPSLVEHYDFVVVDSSIWKHLSSWYDFDNQICRRLIPDAESFLKLDLYPEEIIKKPYQGRNLLTTVENRGSTEKKIPVKAT